MAKRNADNASARVKRAGGHEKNTGRGAEKSARQAGETRRAVPAEEAAAAAKAAKPKRRRSKGRRALRTVKIVLIVLLAVVIALGGLATWLGYRVSNNGKNLPNVFLDGIDVGGLSQEETLKKLNESGWDEQAATPLTVQLPVGVSFELDRREAGVALTAETAAKAAFRYGHGGNWYENLLRYGETYLSRVDVGLDFLTLNEDYVQERVREGLRDFAKATAPVEEAYTVDRENEQLRLVKGAGEAKIDEEKLLAAVKEALLAGETALDYRHIDNELTEPDFEAIYKELAVEPADAYFVDDGSFQVVDEVVGCSFDVAEAKTIWEKAALMDEVVIPLTITEPEVTGEALRGMLFRDVLGSQTTYFKSSSDNRINNIKLAASRINDVVLMPGESFSYNETIGQRTKEAGFLEAGAYADGEVVQEIGGGICQVSSTLYCATMFANLETVSRTNHYFRVDYLPIAYDATVSWPGPDFKFKNNREYPIKIVAYTGDDKSLTVEIHGTDVDGSYVELTNHQYVVYDTTYTDVVVGWGGQAVRHVYDKDGNWLEDIKEPYGIYNKHAEDIEWPAEKVAAESGSAVVETVGDDGGTVQWEGGSDDMDDDGETFAIIVG